MTQHNDSCEAELLRRKFRCCLFDIKNSNINIILLLRTVNTKKICQETPINILSAKDGDLRFSASNACLPKTEISVFVTECVFFTSTCYKLHMFTLHDVLYSSKEEMFLIILV